MNPIDFSKTIKMPIMAVPEKKKGPGRYSTMFNDVQSVIDINTFGSSLIMTLANASGKFLVNHRFTLDGEKPRYSFQCQYKDDKIHMNSVWVQQPGLKAFMKWSPSERFTQEVNVLLLRSEQEFFKSFVTRSVYSDEDSCIELLLDNQSGLSMTYNQSITDKLSVGVEGYYDYLSNKNLHVAVSGCYKDSLRQWISTFTSNYTLFNFYLRTVNKNVKLGAGCNITSFNKPSEMRATCVVGFDFQLPRTKARIQTTCDFSGTVKSVLREQLGSNAQISFSGEFNPFFDIYRFGLSFLYGVQLDKFVAFTPLSGDQK